ncbi:MAG TPA: FxLYD domain-containing protein [Candidatus Paceibacterota bacterium]|nr:FxLYD domain-containing protein [Candidatus Paceibacterota bacterium]
MTWASKRKFFYVIILVLFLGVFGFLIISPTFNRAPSCFDNKKNGTEVGVDCGGSCSNASCYAEPVSILWSRAFKVVPGRYNAVAYLENHNKNSAINKISYRFRFADKNNIYIGKREGTTYIPPTGRFAIFEPGIDIGNSVPVYTTFEFTQTPQWVTVSQEKLNQLKVSVSDINLVGVDTSPVLTATIKNNSFFTIGAVDVIAILYDSNHNAVSTSRTYLEKLTGGESRNITFTWPEPIPSSVIEKEMIPLFNIFSVQLK